MELYSKKVQERFAQMSKSGKLFRVKLSGEEIWDLYLKSFSKENDPVFRDPESTVHNCNHCNNFIRRYGNIVSVDENYNVVTMFDVEADEEYANTSKVLSTAIKSSQIAEVFFETFNELNSLPYESCTKTSRVFQLGVAKNVKRYTKEEAEKFGVVKPNEILTFNHIHLFVDKEFVDTSGKSVESIMGDYRDAKNVFQRAMETISLDTLNLVRDLIKQGSLYDGTAHLYKIEAMIPLKQEYDDLAVGQRDNWCWVKSYKFSLAKFRNELIGVLCTELSEGEDLNKAWLSWNKRADKTNYMKMTAPVTQKQIAEDVNFLTVNGYESAFQRRFATLDDIKISEVLYSNVGDGKIKTLSIFDNVKATSTRHKRNEFNNVEEVTIDKFRQDILPYCSSVEAFLTNNQEGNLVSLTTAVDKSSKSIFKWDNTYSWTFNGNLAGKTQIKEAVKIAGGNIEGVLRFSMIWNDKDGKDDSDLDCWCLQSDGTRIGFSSPYRKDRSGTKTTFSGILDLDNTTPNGKIAIENIYFSDLKKMKDGVYLFWVNQFKNRNSQGFKAEIEFDGNIYTYNYDNPVNGNVQVAKVTLKNGQFSIEHLLPETETTSKELYGLETNKFHKVNLVCMSPNYWGENSVGSKHYLFMLENCKSPTSISGFHIENLNSDVIKAKRTLSLLGNLANVESTDKQLSGLGFNDTVRDELIVKLQGTHKRIIKIKF